MFQLHPRLQADTLEIGRLTLCELRLMNDSRFPWIILVPMREAVSELHQLSVGEQQLLLAESSSVANCLAEMETVEKINVAALGNLVAQFHWHLVGRSRTDPCWPGPVWGCGEAQPYTGEQAEGLILSIRRFLDL
jgi:diadenosine tetraphosphate (Ap4A) HIT family hydrolase